MRRRVWTFSLSCCLSLTAAVTQAAEPPATVRQAMPMLREMLAIPNVAGHPEQVAANVAHMRTAFESRGFQVQALETGGPPLLLARMDVDPDLPTHLIYLQVDGQPVDPSAWDQDDPFVPVLKARDDGGWARIPWERLGPEYDPEWRVFARSASDAKGPIAMTLTALDRIAADGERPAWNVKVVMDFEEELGSPHLPAAVERYREALAADALLVFDGPRHPSNRPTLIYGARGIATLTLTVYGPKRAVHSGHYGNWAPNPAQNLAELLASMKDPVGRVTVEGFYDGIEITDAERALLDAVPYDEPELMRTLGFSKADAVGDSLMTAIQYPSLNIRGMAAGWVGDEVRTIIPATAVAEIDIRLVPASDPIQLIEQVRGHVRDQGYELVDGEPSDAQRASHPRLASITSRVSYAAFRTPVESPVGRWLSRTLEASFGEPPIEIPMLGGSVPISPFVEALDLPAVLVTTVNPDNNQHSPDENLRLGNLDEGVRSYEALLRSAR